MPAAEPAQFTVEGDPALRGEAAGEGPPIVLCHGITATRRYVVHGSRALERAGHRVVAYDARGHGESDPAPAGQGYGYPELVGDLERVVAGELGEGESFALAGHSMGAHTAVAYALAHPERLSALVVIGPVYEGRDRGRVARVLGRPGRRAGGRRRRRLRRVHRRATRRPTPPGATRCALHPRADARPPTPRRGRRGAARGARLAALRLAGGARAPGDADAGRRQPRRRRPGPPAGRRRGLRGAHPGRRLAIEDEGASPLAWQGGRLSREIADFCAAAEAAKTQE